MEISRAVAQVLLAELLACEEGVWTALVAGDATADAAALTEDFLGVYASGPATRVDHVAQLAAGPTVRSYALSGAQVRMLGMDHALLSYRADFARPGDADGATRTMYVTSVWQRRLVGWANLFSQDTPAT